MINIINTTIEKPIFW